MSDEEILRISYNNPSRFGEIFDRHHKRFLMIARRALRSSSDAEDVVQETFVKIYKYGRKFSQNGGSFKQWSNTILGNCVRDQIKKYQKGVVTFSEEIENVTADESEPENRDAQNTVSLIFEKIDGAASEILKLRYLLGKSFKGIGRALNITSGTARVRVYRAKKIFEETYKQFNLYEK